MAANRNLVACPSCLKFVITQAEGAGERIRLNWRITSVKSSGRAQQAQPIVMARLPTGGR
jgi:hypothetical protein